MNELALFAGAGGGILGGHILGWRTVCAVEFASYPRSVLLARQRDGMLPKFPVWDDVRTFDGKPWRRTVDVVSGGFPCQDISVAGKGDGLDGERSGLWSEMARIIGEVQPRFAFVENSPMLTSRGLDRVLGDLSTLGYDAEWGVVGADDAGAPHRRERIWILAHAQRIGSRREANAGVATEFEQGGSRMEERTTRTARFGDRPNPIGQLADPVLCGCVHRQAEEFAASGRVNALGEPIASGENLADTNRVDAECGPRHGPRIPCAESCEGPNDHTGGRSEDGGGWWKTEPGLGRVANGVARRVDRLKAIGNGQVPQVAALAWNTLYERIQKRLT
jgi:DNA (cytosine-5)-methyltransferase 1